MANIVDFYGVVVSGVTGVYDINNAQTPFDVYNSNAQLVGAVLSLNPVVAIATASVGRISLRNPPNENMTHYFQSFQNSLLTDNATLIRPTKPYA